MRVFLILGLGLLSAGFMWSQATPAKPETPKPSAAVATSGAPKPSVTPSADKKPETPKPAATAAPVAGVGGAPAGYDFPVMAEDEVSFIERTIAKYRDRIAADRAEIDIIRAQINKMLIPRQPDVEQIKQLIRKSLEWEGDIRVAEIERQIDLRKQFGDDRWTSLSQRLRTLKNQLKDSDGVMFNGISRRWFHIVRTF